MLRKFFLWLAGRSQPKRCSRPQCWLPAERKHKGHHLCAQHYHDYTYDIGITGNKL